ncbi:transporter [Marinobacter qingdaonensis]|uniref:Transporter n=1 Tax=Marinobacter qingdaonensis TaxID=3108486 RepID=A0ABU5NVT3_9GAMM|nr:transporter [Marinobacter sp. ASW11-75]MEA1079923.1 transporter [Marinobacter sp. ASW11-75]
MRSTMKTTTVTAFVQASALALATGLGATSAQAAEIATDPGDYTPLPAGVNLGLLYGQYATRDTVYSDGDKVPVDAGLDTTIGLARFVHYMDIGGIIVDPQIIVPFGKVELKETFGPLQPTSESGVGDPIVGATAWVLNQPEAQQWVGLSAFVSVPVGQYDEDKGPVNIGENRWKGIFQAAYVKHLSNRVVLDLIAEYSVYGDNDDFLGVTREQDDAQSLQAHMRYLLPEQSHLALSYYHSFGGETTVGGQEQDDRVNTNRWLATYATFVAPTVQLQVQAGQDIHVENGFEEEARVNLRVLKVF